MVWSRGGGGSARGGLIQIFFNSNFFLNSIFLLIFPPEISSGMHPPPGYGH